MDGTNFIVPDRHPWRPAGVKQVSAWEAAGRVAICAAVVVATFGLLVGLAAFGIAIPVLEAGAIS